MVCAVCYMLLCIPASSIHLKHTLSTLHVERTVLPRGGWESKYKENLIHAHKEIKLSMCVFVRIFATEDGVRDE